MAIGCYGLPKINFTRIAWRGILIVKLTRWRVGLLVCLGVTGMNKTIHAIFENGIFRPIESGDLPEKSKVEFELRLVAKNKA